MKHPRATLLVACVVVATLCASSPAAAATASAPFVDRTVIGKLSQPIALAQLPNGKLLVAQKGGTLLLVSGTKKKTVLTVPVCDGGEMGLLGVALDPDFADNGFIYLYRTKPAAGGCDSAAGRFNQVVRVRMAGEKIDPTTLTELLTGITTDSGAHNAGALRIGPDGKLYIAVGDAAIGDNQGPPGSSTNPYAQDLASLNGKILRINLDGSVPGDNPFVGSPGARPEIWAYGFRNPFRFGFDPQSGNLWVGDVGDFAIEEVDIVTAGASYGWPHCEATLPLGCQQPGDIDPVFTYPHTGVGALGSSIVGGAFAPSGFGAYAGDYFWGDFIVNRLYRSTPNGSRDGLIGSPTTTVSGIGQFYGGPVDIIFGADGALYYAQLNPGELHRVIPAAFDERITGKTLTMTAASPSKRTLKAIAGDPNISLGAGEGSVDDPVVHGGSLRIVGDGIDDSYPLPAGQWSYLGKAGNRTGVKFKPVSKTAPITGVNIKKGKTLSISGKGSGLGHSFGSNPAPVNIELSTGDKRYCLTFGGTVKFDAAKQKFQAKNAPLGECP